MRVIFTLSALMSFTIAYAGIFQMEPLEVRTLINTKCFEVEGIREEIAHVEELVIECEKRTTPVRIYKPSEAPDLPRILMIHGGAWIGGSLDTHDNLARYLCKHTGALVVSVQYQNSPEGKFPLPLEQCYDALNWLEQMPTDAKEAPPLAIVGDSAGGNMAAALTLMARDRKGPKIAFQALINPAPDLSCKGVLKEMGDPMDQMRYQALMYVASEEDLTNPYVSPLLASDHSNLPPALVVLAENDTLLRADGEAYAEKLRKAGIPTEQYLQKGIGHLAGDGARVSPRAKESIDVVVHALSQSFYKQ